MLSKFKGIVALGLSFCLLLNAGASSIASVPQQTPLKARFCSQAIVSALVSGFEGSHVFSQEMRISQIKPMKEAFYESLRNPDWASLAIGTLSAGLFSHLGGVSLAAMAAIPFTHFKSLWRAWQLRGFPKRVALLGRPGAGKGEHGKRLSQVLRVPYVVMSDILKAAVQSGDFPEAKQRMDAGDLVEDEMVLNILYHELSKPQYRHGFILDGFPRNIVQLQRLTQSNIPVDVFIYFDIHPDTYPRRAAQRRADYARRGLIPRPDDTPTKVAHRSQVYEQETQPLILHLKADAREPFIEVNSDVPGDKTFQNDFDSIEYVFDHQILPVLQRWQKQRPRSRRSMVNLLIKPSKRITLLYLAMGGVATAGFLASWGGQNILFAMLPALLGWGALSLRRRPDPARHYLPLIQSRQQQLDRLRERAKDARIKELAFRQVEEDPVLSQYSPWEQLTRTLSRLKLTRETIFDDLSYLDHFQRLRPNVLKSASAVAEAYHELVHAFALESKHIREEIEVLQNEMSALRNATNGWRALLGRAA